MVDSEASIQTIRCLLTLLSDELPEPCNHPDGMVARTEQIVKLVEQAAQSTTKMQLLGASSAASHDDTPSHGSDSIDPRRELVWFAKFSWNHGIRATKSKQSELGRRLFAACVQFDSLYPGPENVHRRKMCHLMTASASITQLAEQQATLPTERLRAMVDGALDSVRTCRLLARSSAHGTDVQLERLLTTLEFHGSALAGREAHLRQTLDAAARTLPPELYPELYNTLGEIARATQFFQLSMEAFETAVIGAVKHCVRSCQHLPSVSAEDQVQNQHAGRGLCATIKSALKTAGSCSNFQSCQRIAQHLVNFVVKVRACL